MFGYEIDVLSPIHRLLAVFRNTFTKQQHIGEQLDANPTNTEHSTKHQEERTRPTRIIIDPELLWFYKAMDLAG